MLLDLDEDVDSKIFLFGAFDVRGLKLIERIMRGMKCRTAFDVGANIGNHTGHFCDWADRVYAFEPNPPIVARLATYVADNGLANVAVVPCGLSSENGDLTMYVYPGAAGTTTLEAKSVGAVEAGKVRVRRGDSIVEEYGIENVDFVKIDVQEHEYEVLTGLQSTIARDRPIVFMEFFGNSFEKFGGAEGLSAMLPNYKFFGTGKGVMSKLFKTSLRFEPFVYGVAYDHLVCVPQSRMEAFKLWAPPSFGSAG